MRITVTVDELMARAFAADLCRDPRSPEYKAGVRAALRFRIEGWPIPLPYPAGSAQSDAYHAGIDEGHRRWREVYEAMAPGGGA